MRLGAVFPQTEIGDDPAAVRDWIQTVEGLGYDDVLIYDHVLGADISKRDNWPGPYTSETLFHEVFVTLGYFAALTERVGLATNVLILSQRQTALAAKQAAEIDVLSGGRLRLGIGTGWNYVEYECLNENFHNRGKRSEEQIAVLRALWADPVITFKGKWHTIVEAGIKPLPPRRSIPIWLGGAHEAVLDRVGRIGDGWMCNLAPHNPRTAASIGTIRQTAQAAGRDPAAIGLTGRIVISRTPRDQWTAMAETWAGLGATHLDIVTMDAGLANPRAHLDVLKQVKDTLG